MSSKLETTVPVGACSLHSSDSSPSTCEELPLGHGESILLVEDEEEHRLAVRKMLERLGYSVVTAGDAQEALTVYRGCAQKISAVLTDLLMPGDMDGAELAKALAAMAPGIKVMILSGYPLSQIPPPRDQESWLEKPVTLERLALALEQALRG